MIKTTEAWWLVGGDVNGLLGFKILQI